MKMTFLGIQNSTQLKLTAYSSQHFNLFNFIHMAFYFVTNTSHQQLAAVIQTTNRQKSKMKKI